MDSSRNRMILVGLAVLVVAGFFWSRQKEETPPSEPGVVAEEENQIEEEPEEKPGIGNQNPVTEGEVGEITGVDPNRVHPDDGEPFTAAYEKCWGKKPPTDRLGEATDPKSLTFALERESSDSQTMYENYHVQTPQGDRRLQVLYQENFPIELRLFSVDSEGLPIPERLTNDETQRPVDEVLKGYLAQGTVTARMAHREINLPNGISAEVETSDDEPVEVRVFGMPGGTLSCFQDKCKCISGRAQRADPSSIPTE